ncbi:MAG TPA: M48 family metallopeptidase [Methylomirabilota bacterium]|nr:M48 family metallopeptidase [Methylomirabilota bacterium]
MQGMTGLVGVTAAAAVMLAACATTTEKGVVGVERSQLLLVSSAEMDQSAAAAYQNVLKEEGSKGAVNQNPQQVERIRRIAARLIPQTAVFRKDAPAWKWEVNVITSPEPNAWCMPGGKIAFYTGILDKLQMNDDEVAAVMGHEIAHALREHGRERASQQIATAVGAGVVGSALGVGKGGTDLVALVGQVTFLLPYSRLHETEADRMGVELAARAGYDPRAAIALWQKMAKLADGGGTPSFLSTHPSNEERIKDLGVFSQKVMPLYEQARAKP